MGILKNLLEATARCSIIALLMGIIFTVYSSHNPLILEYVWVFRVTIIIWIIWIFIPFYEFYIELKKHATEVLNK